MRRSSQAVALAALALAALAPASPALAFCRTSSCTLPSGEQVTGAVCTPALPDDCGLPLFWPSLCVGYSLQKAASPKEGISLSETQELFQQAFATWTTASCAGGGTPRIAVKEAEPATCSKHEYNQKAGNANIITFRDESWPYEGSSNTLALTTVTYNLDTGEIYDADMELNSADLHFTTKDTGVEFDLLSVITHEAGHFLGLAHSTEQAATMFPSYSPGDTGLRDLDDDDRAGICAIYPPGAEIPATCDTTPRHGFSTLCADQQGSQEPTEVGGCCAVAPGTALPGGRWASAAAAAGVAALFFRRRKRALPER